MFSYYYCPAKSYTLRIKDILPFITVFCDLNFFPACFLSKVFFSHFIGCIVLPECSNSSAPFQLFHCQLHYFETYFPVKNNCMRLLIPDIVYIFSM